MGATTTKTSDLFKIDVIKPILSYTLEKELGILDFLHIDKSLTKANVGDTLQLSAYTYIGKAGEVQEGEAIPTHKLGHTKTSMTVKKSANGVEITDEAMKRDIGDPIKEGVTQIGLSIIEEQVDNAFKTIYTTSNLQKKDNKSKIIDYDGVVEASALLGKPRKNHARVLIIHEGQHFQLLKDPNFMDASKYGSSTMISGEIGMIGGCRVVVDNNILLGTTTTVSTITTVDNGAYGTLIMDVNLNKNAPIQEHAVTMLIEKDYDVETQRNAKNQINEIYGSVRYGVYVSNLKKVALVTFKSK